MANLVSIDWSVEEFRRLISEQSEASEGARSTEKAHSTEKAPSTEKTVDVLGLEIQPAPATIDPEPSREHAGLLEAETASEGLPSIAATQVVTQPDELSDLVVAEVMALTASQAGSDDEPVPSRDADRVRDIALDILHSEASQPSNVLVGNAGSTASSEVDIATLPQAPAGEQLTKPEAAVEPEVQQAPARLLETEVRHLQLPQLEGVVVEPDLLAQRFDSARAIELRWVLRDIRSNRIKWSPPREADLNVLIELDLVTMRDGLPQLTASGLSTI